LWLNLPSPLRFSRQNQSSAKGIALSARSLTLIAVTNQEFIMGKGNNSQKKEKPKILATRKTN
jgi:hypothetical protein